MRPDAEYTVRDHELRGNDPYALAKYRITARWLTARGAGGDLFHVGCGSGIFNRMAVDLGFSVTAFEPDPAAYELAARDRPAERCSVSSLTLEEIEPEGRADVVVMHDVLEHIEDDGAAMAHVRALLRDDGLLVLSVPALPSLFGYHDEQLGHYRRYTRSTLRNVVDRHFEITRLRSYGFTFIPVTLWYSRLRRRPYPEPGGNHGFLGKTVERLCRIEERLHTPMGTSLILEARCRA